MVMKNSDNYQIVEIPLEKVCLKGNLRLADPNKGIIIFCHGSGSSRLSPRNNYVADFLRENGFSSLLFDLLTQKEDMVYENRFDLMLLTNRLIEVTDWVSKNDSTRQLSIGYFGASTGAASALIAASKLENKIKAVVSRGGRPDLAKEYLKGVLSPTLLLVGSKDDVVIELNVLAKEEIGGYCELTLIDGATHLFSEPGKLELVALHAEKWFKKYLN